MENFTRDAWCDIDYALNNNEDCKKYILRLINFLIENDNRWVKINNQNPRMWIDYNDSPCIILNEEWFDEIILLEITREGDNNRLCRM